MSSTASTPQSPLRMITLVFVLLLGIVVLLSAAVMVGPGISRALTETFEGEADLITPRVPFIDSWSELDKDSWEPRYSGVIIQSPEALPEARALRAVESALHSTVGLLAGAALILVSLGLLRGRGFTSAARWVVGSLGVFVMITAVAAPQLDALAVDIAVQQLGYPIFNSNTDTMMTENSSELVFLALWDPLWTLDRVDFAVFTLGAVIALTGFLVRDGVRLQRALAAALAGAEPAGASPARPAVEIPRD